MQSKEEFQMTTDELKKFEESMKNPEFKKLFFDYMQEISDPKNRELYEKELEQLEREKGNKVRYVKPEPCFVIKSDVYVNICSSTEIEKCSNKKSNWSIPYSLSKPRKEKKKDKEFDVYDCVYHPETIQKCNNERFKEMVISVALEGIEKQFNTKISKNYKLLKGKKSEGTPLMTIIREKDQSLPVQEETSLDFVEKLVKETPKFEIPKFKIVHQQNFQDYQRFTGERVLQHGSRPDSLVVRIELPKLDSAKEIDVDVQERTLDLEVPTKYRLHLDLPFPVLHEKSNAKFDKQKRTLILTLPVEQLPIPEPVAVAAEKPTLQEQEDSILEPTSNSMIQEVLESDSAQVALTTSLEDSNDLSPQLSATKGTSSDDGEKSPSVDRNESKTVSEPTEALTEKLVALNVKEPEEDLGPLQEKLKELNVQSEQPKSKALTPQFTAHQSDEIATLIIKVADVNAQSVQVEQERQKLIVSFPSADALYKLHLEFDNEYEKYHLNVSTKNICLLLHKSKRENWTHMNLVEEDMTSILSFLSLDNVPYDTPSGVCLIHLGSHSAHENLCQTKTRFGRCESNPSGR
jgi:dynein assembly factor 2